MQVLLFAALIMAIAALVWQQFNHSKQLASQVDKSREYFERAQEIIRINKNEEQSILMKYMASSTEEKRAQMQDLVAYAKNLRLMDYEAYNLPETENPDPMTDPATERLSSLMPYVGSINAGLKESLKGAEQAEQDNVETG